MTRFLAASFLVLILAVGAYAPVAYAQDAPSSAAPAGAAPAAPKSAEAEKAAAKTPTTPQENPKNDSSYGEVMIWIMGLFAWLVGVAAITLDNAVFYTVVTMGNYVNNLHAVGTAWRILRDLGNIILIFGFLAGGIATILNVEIYGWSKKMIPKLLIAAVLINFSLFISQAVIDTGNLFATQFYTQINGGNPAGQKEIFNGGVSKEGISNKLMNQLGLQTLYGDGKANPDILKAGNSWFIGFMGIILFIITAFVLFSLAFILIARFVALLFLMILAPIGFAGLAVPKLNQQANQWWGALFEQTITAPILLLLLYVALKIITDPLFLTGFGVANSSGFWTGFIANGNLNGFASIVLSFLVAMGLLLAVTVFAKKMAAFGASGAMKLAGKASFGASAWAGRATLGRGANFAAKGLRKTAFARVPLVGTGLVKGLDKVAGGSFDIRGTSALKNFPLGGIDAGAAQKGGYKADVKSSVEAQTKYASELKGKEFKDLSSQDQFALAQLQADLEKAKKDQKEAKTPEDYGAATEAIKKQETIIEEFNKRKGTEMGNKLKYAETLSRLVFTSNTEAAKKIKEEAKKSKEDKDLDALRKALKKAGGEEGHGAEKPATGGGGAEKPASSGGGGGTKPSAAPAGGGVDH